MSDLPDQLEGLHRQMETLTPQLYRHLALYLQVLREVLPGRVDQAAFHLATQVHPARYTALPGRQREHLHRRLRLLVERCCSLLTVEQLSALAARIEKERRTRPGPDPASADSLPGPESPLRQGLPEGSVQLGLDSPLSHAWMAGWNADALFRPAAAGSFPTESRTPPSDGPYRAEPAAAQDPDQAPGRNEPPQAEPGGPDEPHEPDEEVDEGEAGGEVLIGPDGPTFDAPAGLWGQGQLPRIPQLQLRWLEGMELSLVRRLRNLSHALNVELLRAGLSRSLLPVSLLDAVLDGQLETSTAPPNLLRLALPFGLAPDGEAIEVLAILLRCPDLEMEEPRLRTCRRRLDLHRQELRRMARQFRRLQRRHQAHQAEQLWLQDLKTIRPAGG